MKSITFTNDDGSQVTFEVIGGVSTNAREEMHTASSVDDETGVVSVEVVDTLRFLDMTFKVGSITVSKGVDDGQGHGNTAG